MARILLIDDDELLRELLQLRLELEGFEVSTAADGEEGVRRLREEAHDLVVLDLMMPIMDGLLFLRSLSGGGAPPVIVASAAAHGEHEAALLGFGAVRAVLRKPVDPGLLVERIRDILGEAA